ncbi:MAG: PKD domain-containing protein, partial [Thermoplasmata archaeon]|nr:PKD domain-containing protein [Thermoplasmata archaeon]
LYSIANIAQAFYEGAGFADFSGHGSPTSFATHPHGNDKIWLPPGGVKSSNVGSFVNREKLPITILNACSTCKFSRGNCFGWSFLSNPDGGGIATCGNTGLGWSYTGKWTTYGLCGLMELNSFKSYASGVETFGEMWGETLNRDLNKFGGSMGAGDYKTVEEWEAFGDPSLKISSYSPPTNSPPEKPERPSGEIKGKIGKEYEYTTSTTDPNGDKVYYMFDWGDGYSEWLGPYESGETISASHTWEKKGEYEIRVKAKDEYGSQSEWSDPLVISMPKFAAKTIFDMLNDWLYELLGIKIPFLP